MNIYKEMKKVFPVLEELFSAENLEAFTNKRVSDLWAYHVGLDTWIKNNVLYPEESNLYILFIENGIEDTDEMSAFIIESFHYYLQSKTDNNN